jgi:murein DD-endopeptidase MepM/ murein hydrolase activator NlpD
MKRTSAATFAAILLGWAAPAADAAELRRAERDGIVVEGPARVVPGGGLTWVRVRLSAPDPTAKVEGWMDRLRTVFFPVDPARAEFAALIGMPFGQKKGEVPFEVDVTGARGKVSIPFPLLAGDSGSDTDVEVLDAEAEKVRPVNARSLERITREEAEVEAIYGRVTPERRWRGRFVQPLKGSVSSPFGRYRVYSEHIRRRIHWGADLRAPVGTVTRASGAGKVVLAKELYFAGRTIIIDHGYGLYSQYAHLRDLRVKVGEHVEGGQVIGTSGITGKTTGPHLHWQAVLNQVKIDPFRLVAAEPPFAD